MKFFLTSLLLLILSFSFSQKLTWGPEFEDHSFDQFLQSNTRMMGDGRLVDAGPKLQDMGKVDLLGEIDGKIVGIIAETLYFFGIDGTIESIVQMQGVSLTLLNKKISRFGDIIIFNNKLLVFTSGYDQDTKTYKNYMSEVQQDGKLVNSKVVFDNYDLSDVKYTATFTEDSLSLTIQFSGFNWDKKKFVTKLNVLDLDFNIVGTPIEFVAESSSKFRLDIQAGKSKVGRDGSIIVAATGLVKNTKKFNSYLDYAKYDAKGVLMYSKQLVFPNNRGCLSSNIIFIGENLDIPVLYGYYLEEGRKKGIWTSKCEKGTTTEDVEFYESVEETLKGTVELLSAKVTDDGFKIFEYLMPESTRGGGLSVINFDNNGKFTDLECIPTVQYESLQMIYKSNRKYLEAELFFTSYLVTWEMVIGYSDLPHGISLFYLKMKNDGVEEVANLQSYADVITEYVILRYSDDGVPTKTVVPGDVTDYLIIPGVNTTLLDGTLVMIAFSDKKMRLVFVK